MVVGVQNQANCVLIERENNCCYGTEGKLLLVLPAFCVGAPGSACTALFLTLLSANVSVRQWAKAHMLGETRTEFLGPDYGLVQA